MKNDELLHKWINGEISKEELDIFKSRPEFAALTALYKSTEGLSAPAFDDKRMLSTILEKNKKMDNSKTEGKRVFLTSWVKYAAAASVLLFALWFLASEYNSDGHGGSWRATNGNAARSIYVYSECWK